MAVNIEIVTQPTPAPTCAYAAQCRGKYIAEFAAFPDLIAALPECCATLRKRDVRAWYIRDCQKAMGFEPCSK